MDVPDPRRNPRDRQSRVGTYGANRRCTSSLWNVTRRIATCVLLAPRRAHGIAIAEHPTRWRPRRPRSPDFKLRALGRAHQLRCFPSFHGGQRCRGAAFDQGAILRTWSWSSYGSGSAIGRSTVLSFDLAQSFRFRKNSRQRLVCCRIPVLRRTEAPRWQRRNCLQIANP